MAEPEQRDIPAAVKILREGGLVAFPTETVYGLGADARNSSAVEKIFAAKGRPSTNPLIVHVFNETVAKRYALRWPPMAQQLAKAFWPGPLTLIVPKTDEIVSSVTAGLDSVGLRVPDHRVALRLLEEFDGPVAAPSANRSGRVSPTTAEHVQSELGDKVDFILDGGPCRVGIESTILSLLDHKAVLFRPGGISRRQIEEVIGPVEIAGKDAPEGSAISPGQMAVHYSPKATMLRFDMTQAASAIQWLRSHPKQPALILSLSGLAAGLQAAGGPHCRFQAMPSDPASYAQKLYALLHDADQQGVEAILAEMPPDSSDWMAIRDRLTRASVPI